VVWSLLVVLLHAGLFVAVALAVLVWQGRRSSLVGDLVRRAKEATGVSGRV
jgi:hypothetical protein